MSKFGWDYPPGCTQAMVDEAIGCGPEAEAAEAFGDAFYEQAEKLGIVVGENDLEILCGWVWKQIGDAYARGYAQANADRALAETEHLADEKWP